MLVIIGIILLGFCCFGFKFLGRLAIIILLGILLLFIFVKMMGIF
jgi:hypothetical protein